MRILNTSWNWKEGAPLHIECIRSVDIPEILELWRMIPSINAALGKGDEPCELEAFLEKNPTTSLVIKDDLRIVGTILGGYDGRRGYVYHLAVHPSLQEKGYGKRLLKELLERFKSLGVVKVHLFVFKENCEAIAFYKHLGWTHRDDIDVFSMSIDGFI
jgi:ribosomal protein S18 acetylase RimI-like enzyme